MTDPERQILDHFRRQFNEMRADLSDFTAAFDGEDMDGWSKAHIRDWCVAWWEARLGGKVLSHGERRLRGDEGRN